MKKATILATSSLAALALPQAAFAQDEDTPERRPSRSGDIVVTATRIATEVQDVPIAITALSAETLEDRQLTTLSDLGNVVPNATFRKSQGIYGAGVSVALRGQERRDTQFSGEPPVAYYIDDVYYPFMFGSNFDLLDIERVEVLRGPQGTLFGRNAISGAINIVSKTPSLSETSGYVDLTVGSYNRIDVRAGVSLPLTDTLAVSASMVAKKQHGYMDLLDFSCEMYRRGTPELAGTFPFQTEGTTFVANNQPGDCTIGHYGGEDQRAARIAAYWEPTPGIRFRAIGDYTNNNDESAAEAVIETNYNQTYGLQEDGTIDPTLNTAQSNFITAFDQFSVPGTPFRWDERFETGSVYKTYDNFCDPFPQGTLIPGNTMYNGSLYKGGSCNKDRRVPLESWGVSGKLEVDLTDEITATAVGGYREVDTVFGAGWDGTVLNDSFIFHEDHMWYWSGEFRVAGTFDAFDFVGGLFYYDGYADETGRPQNHRLGTQQYQRVLYYPEAKAAYLNVTLRPFEALGIAEGLSLTGGVRRSDDRKFVDYSALQDASAPGSTTFTPSATSTVFTLPIENKRWDWKLGADYQINNDMLVYVSAATGYSLPSFQTRVFQVGQFEQQSETALTNYEIGTKLDLFDRRLRLNLAAFYQKFTAFPATFGGQEARYDPTNATLTILPGDQTLIPDGPANTAFSNAFTNCRDYMPSDGAPNGTTVGIQCVSRTFNYSDPSGRTVWGLEGEVTFEPVDDLVFTGSFGYTKRDSSTGRPLFFPDWTGSGGVQYTFEVPVLDGAITPRIDWFYNSTIAYSTNFPEYDDAPRSTFNGRISYENLSNDWSLALGVTNLFDKQYFLQKTIFIQAIGAPANIGQPAPPREWYLTLSKRF